MNFDDFDLEIQCDEYYSKDEDWEEINKILAEEDCITINNKKMKIGIIGDSRYKINNLIRNIIKIESSN